MHTHLTLKAGSDHPICFIQTHQDLRRIKLYHKELDWDHTDLHIFRAWIVLQTTPLKELLLCGKSVLHSDTSTELHCRRTFSELVYNLNVLNLSSEINRQIDTGNIQKA